MQKPKPMASKSPIQSLLLAVVILLLSSACSNRATSQPDGPVTETSKNPLTDLRAAAAAGQPLYAVNCAMCHGNSGKGEGAAGASLAVNPTDLTTGSIHSDPDGKLFLVIKNGKTTDGKIVMPPVRRLSDEQIWQMVAYVRTLAQP
jgi:mono/diheme cytochrome c family protein